MGRRANIVTGVVEDEILEVDQLTVHPERCAGIGEVKPLKDTVGERRPRRALVETNERYLGT